MSASLKTPRAAGAVFSAARFMLSSNSSILPPKPPIRKPFSAMRSFSGMRILMALFLKNPSAVPVRSTACSVPICRASFNPEDVLESLCLLPFTDARQDFVQLGVGRNREGEGKQRKGQCSEHSVQAGVQLRTSAQTPRRRTA